MTEPLITEDAIQQLKTIITKPWRDAEPDMAFLSPAELAERLGVTERILKTWRTTGDGPPFVKGERKMTLYPVRELLEWEKGLKVVRSTAEL